jgi:hypothetical protein
MNVKSLTRSYAVQLDKNVFSIRFAKDSSNKGELILGDDDSIDETKYMDVITPHAWAILLKTIKVGKTIVRLDAHGALIDLSLAFIYLPDKDVKKIYGKHAELTDNGVWVVQNPFPYDVKFLIGQESFTIPKADIQLSNTPKHGNKYLGAFQNGGTAMPILGLPFVKNHFMAFDFGRQKVGIVPRS